MPAGSGNDALSGIAAGSVFPVDNCASCGATSRVDGGCCGSALGTNSATVPLTCTWAANAAAAGGGPLVKTKMPSDVFGSAS